MINKTIAAVISIGIVLMLPAAGMGQAQVNVGRFQLVAVSAAQQAGVFLVDTHSGCTWQLASNTEANRLSFVEMDVENLHWSFGSGAQQKLAQKIEETNMPADQKRLFKQELSKSSCGVTPILLTPGQAPSAAEPAPAPPTQE